MSFYLIKRFVSYWLTTTSFITRRITVKKLFRKNQLIITALALMIAVAGYFSCMNDDIDDIVIPMLNKYKDFDLKAVNRAGSDEELGVDKKESENRVDYLLYNE